MRSPVRRSRPGVRSLPDLPAADPAPRGADVTRERLLTATHQLLHERGGRSVSINEIATRAGANVAMVKYCFGSKDAMMQALLARIMKDLAAQIDELDRAELTATVKLTRHVAEIVRNYVRYPYLNRLVTRQLGDASAKGAKAVARDFAAPARDWYRRLFAQGRAAGEFREVDPTFFFFSVIGLCEFMFTAQGLLRHAFGTDALTDDVLERFIVHTSELVLRGVAAAPENGKSRKIIPP